MKRLIRLLIFEVEVIRKEVIICLIFSIFFFGCATHFRERKNEDLVEKFNLDKAGLKEFKSVEIIAPGVEPTSEVTTKSSTGALVITETSSKTIGSKSKTPKKKKIGARSIKRIKEKIVLKKEEVATSSEIGYPADYPQKFIDYDNQFKNMWKLYRPVMYPGEEFKMIVKYLGIPAGYVIINTLPPVYVAEKEAWHIKARLKSADYYKYIYELDDSLETFISKDSFLPMKFQLIQRESIQEVDDLQLFDQKKLKTFFWYRREKRGQLRKHEKSSYIPKYIQDSFSALYFARGLPLKKGIIYEYPIVTRAKIWIVKFKVIGKETIEFNDKEINALKIKAETRFPGVLKKKGDILFWMSDDDRRLFLKFEAKVKIGSVSGKLQEYWPTQKAKLEAMKKKE